MLKQTALHKGRSIAVVLCASAAAVPIGCASGDEETGGVSKTQFLRQGNMVCQKGIAEKDAALQKALVQVEKSDGTPSEEGLEAVALRVLLPAVQGTLDDLRQLPAPPGEDRADEVLAEFEDALGEAEEDPALLIKGNPFEAANEAAGAYGLTACRF